MKTKRLVAVTVGGFVWIAIAMASLWGLSAPASNRASGDSSDPDTAGAAASTSPPAQLWSYWTARRTTFPLQVPELPLRDGDPVFLMGTDGQWHEVGFVASTDSSRRATKAMVVWYDDEFNSADYRLVYYQNRGKFGDIVKMLLPPEKRTRLEALIRKAIDNHADEITEAMKPIVTKSLRESLPVVEQAFKDSLDRHRDELEALGERYEQTVLRERLVPMVKDEVLPIIKKHGEPVAKTIGRELWDRASLWRFGWRALYDKSPLPERDLLKREWERFVDEEAIPVFEKHTPSLIEAQKNIFVDLSKNENIRDEFSDIIQLIVKDKELQRLLTAMMREAIVENEELRKVWMDNWQSTEAKAALKLAGDRLEPLVREIGDELFGTREDGISPSFARVLRNQILGKDKRWLIAEKLADGQTPIDRSQPQPLIPASDWQPYPLVIMAGNESSELE